MSEDCDCIAHEVCMAQKGSDACVDFCKLVEEKFTSTNKPKHAEALREIADSLWRVSQSPKLAGIDTVREDLASIIRQLRAWA